MGEEALVRNGCVTSKQYWEGVEGRRGFEGLPAILHRIIAILWRSLQLAHENIVIA